LDDPYDYWMILMIIGWILLGSNIYLIAFFVLIVPLKILLLTDKGLVHSCITDINDTGEVVVHYWPVSTTPVLDALPVSLIPVMQALLLALTPVMHHQNL
jgi:hypothetical protein